MGCAFTQKVVKLAKMLKALDHEVFFYGAEGSQVACDKFIQTHSLNDIRDAWGDGDNRFEVGYNWRREGFRHDFNTERTQTTLKFYANAIEGIRANKQDDDFLLVMQGTYHKPISEAVKLFLTVEPGIGYRGSYTNYRAFESAYLMNFTYGSEHPRQSINGKFYDRVIPNYYDDKDFTFKENKKNYILFIGRKIQRKGINIPIEVCRHLDCELFVCGQGDYVLPDWVNDCGYVDPDKRAELMSNAKAVFVPTLYLEAFGGVHVEAMLCGTPVITTNFGVFRETVINGVNGYRCDTFNDFVNATKNIHKLDPHVVRAHGERYLMDNVKMKYQKWFAELYQVYETTLDPNKKAWHYLTPDNR